MRIPSVTETPDHHQARPRIEGESTGVPFRCWVEVFALIAVGQDSHSHTSHSTTLSPLTTALLQTHVIKTDSSQTHARLFIGPAWHMGVLSVLYVDGFITFEANMLYKLKSLPRMACDRSSSSKCIIQTIVCPHIFYRMGRPRSTFH